MKKTIFITGASKGIGFETVRIFLESGWNVVATMRKFDDFNVTHENLLLASVDVTNANSIQKAVASGIERFGAIDVVVNNAGYGLRGVFEATPESEVRKQFETNYFGVLNVMRAVLPHMRDRKRGMIINVSSLGGRMAGPLYAQYHATKFALQGLSESMAYELGQVGVTIKLVEPGPVKTDFYGNSAGLVDASAFPEYHEWANAVAGKMASEEERLCAPPIDSARMIYEAATDGSQRLHYIAARGGRFQNFLHNILPDVMWRGMITKMFR